MLTSRQPPPDAPLNAEQAAEAYLGALKECHTALMATTDILAELAQTVVDFLDETDDIDPNALKQVCTQSLVLVASTREQFFVEVSGGGDKTPSEDSIMST